MLWSSKALRRRNVQFCYLPWPGRGPRRSALYLNIACQDIEKKDRPLHTHIRCGKLLPIHLFSIDSVFVLTFFWFLLFSSLAFPSLFLFIHLLLYMFLFSFYLSFFLFSFVQRFSHFTIFDSFFTFFFGFLC